MLFRSSRKKEPESPKLGFRSGLVLAKLGYDLRDSYKDVVEEPLPAERERSLDRLQDPDPATRPDDRKPR